MFTVHLLQSFAMGWQTHGGASCDALHRFQNISTLSPSTGSATAGLLTKIDIDFILDNGYTKIDIGFVLDNTCSIMLHFVETR